jgi:hypothetical protein
MRMKKIAFGFAMTLAVATVAFAGLRMDQGLNVADDVAAQLQGGAVDCYYWINTSCILPGGTGCSNTGGWADGGSINRGYTTTAVSCGGSGCGTIALNWNAGCGEVTSTTAQPPP